MVDLVDLSVLRFALGRPCSRLVLKGRGVLTLLEADTGRKLCFEAAVYDMCVA